MLATYWWPQAGTVYIRISLGYLPRQDLGACHAWRNTVSPKQAPWSSKSAKVGAIYHEATRGRQLRHDMGSIPCPQSMALQKVAEPGRVDLALILQLRGVPSLAVKHRIRRMFSSAQSESKARSRIRSSVIQSRKKRAASWPLFPF